MGWMFMLGRTFEGDLGNVVSVIDDGDAWR